MPGRNTASAEMTPGIGVQINSLNALCARHIHASAKRFARSCNADAHDSFHAGNLDRVFGIRARGELFPQGEIRTRRHRCVAAEFAAHHLQPQPRGFGFFDETDLLAAYAVVAEQQRGDFRLNRAGNLRQRQNRHVLGGACFDELNVHIS